ncbi:hypothetical protein C6Y45_05420 [Alkalicoccus saliphilus]|jgi:selenoprotein W-related protein|uniref:SelT/SelW/SelH family protein n=1 Tax=Alkalicoccus saliphilus TaxID=200989 RepID=A0A2T4U7U7_9BACI|nr:hypothetical protein C6Y45_05420 [Alkalicoccus saliphilus]
MRREITCFELIPSSGGAFEVYKEGKLIYSKLSTGSFPDTESIIKLLK